jgi:hypothetical protein
MMCDIHDYARLVTSRVPCSTHCWTLTTTNHRASSRVVSPILLGKREKMTQHQNLQLPKVEGLCLSFLTGTPADERAGYELVEQIGGGGFSTCVPLLVT